MRRGLIAMTSILLTSTLTGCVETTEQKSARAKLTADRVLASQAPVRVTRRNPQVSVLDVGLVTRHGTSAVAVTLRSNVARPVSDLPISVGVVTGRGRATYLNRAANLPYFQTHVAAIAGAGSVTWVFTTRGAPPAGARPFAAVGFPTVADQAGATSLPTITASTAAPGPGHPGPVSATVTNHSSVPQVGLAVYAIASSGRRLLAAGQTSVAQLDPGDSATVAIRLVGAPAAATVQLSAPPTNLR